jgi:membrane protein DedA with SNARE-associated domain
MIETIIFYLSQVPWYWVLGISLFITFLENIFPPAPCDTALIFCGTLVSLKIVDFFSLLIFSTIGSMLGFILLFRLGRTLGYKMVESRRLPFINESTIKKPQRWFSKYGFSIIVINRFLSGTRAVISFIAGMSNISYTSALILSGISALVWNAILIYIGILLGENWKLGDYYISMYGKIIFPAMILGIVIFFFIKYLRKKRNKPNNSTDDPDVII